MKFNESEWLASKIRQWAEKGLITAEQADAIVKTETEKTGQVKALTLLAALGAVCVAAGVSLVISYNWELIPRFFKIAGILIFLAALAEAVIRLPDERRAFKTVCQILWLFVPLGGIGLYGQIYQLSGDVFKPLITWLVITLPLVVLARHTAVTFLHSAGLIAAIFAGASDPGTFISLAAADPTWSRSGWRGTFGQLIENYGVALALLPILWTWAFVQAKQGLSDRIAMWVLLACLVHVWMVGTVHRTPFTVHSAPAMFLLASSLCALFWAGRQMLLPVSTAGRGWGIVLLSGIYYAMTYLWHVPHERFTGATLAPVPQGALIAPAVAGCSAAILVRMPRLFKVILRYGIGEIRDLPGFPTDEPGRQARVGVRLVPGPKAVIRGSEQQIHIAESVRIPPPRNEPQPEPTNGVWAMGTWTGKGIVYGIERYYFSEKRKEELNSVRSGRVYVAATVGRDGTLRVKDLAY